LIVVGHGRRRNRNCSLKSRGGTPRARKKGDKKKTELSGSFPVKRKKKMTKNGVQSRDRHEGGILERELGQKTTKERPEGKPIVTGTMEKVTNKADTTELTDR